MNPHTKRLTEKMGLQGLKSLRRLYVNCGVLVLKYTKLYYNIYSQETLHHILLKVPVLMLVCRISSQRERGLRCVLQRRIFNDRHTFAV